MNFYFIKRKIERLLSQGRGKQLLWLSMLVVIALMILFVINSLFIGMNSQEIVPNFFGIKTIGEYMWFKFSIALAGTLLFSSLLISVISNILKNISESYKIGESKYVFKNHILIIGGAQRLGDMLIAIRDDKDLKKKNVLVMTASDVQKLRHKMERHLADSAFCKHVNYFHRDRNNLTALKDAYADKASMIYIIGEDNEIAHDALNIRCLNLLKKLCGKSGPIIPCYVVVEMHTTQEVFNYLTDDTSSRLNVEIVNESDYAVEQLLVNTDFLPALTQEDKEQRLRVIIFGKTSIARSFATQIAQICHYPNYEGLKTRTIISLVDYNDADMYSLVAHYSNMFELCHYKYISSKETKDYYPQTKYGDFLDFEWEFVGEQLSSPLVINLIESWTKDPLTNTVFAICEESDAANVYLSSHLPRIVYDQGINIAVFQNNYSDVINNANESGMFGNIFVFGKAQQREDVLFLKRSSVGKRINRIYDLKYGMPPAKDEEEAWNKLPFIHKYSSIASGNSIRLKSRCFNLIPTDNFFRKLTPKELHSIAEVEHRRWMATELILGYRAAPIKERQDRSHFKELKASFIHLDIAPFSELCGEEEKDLHIIQNLPYIVSGEEDILKV